MTSRGVASIHAAFAQARAEGRAAFMPYQMLGHPDPQQSVALVCALAAAGADLFELGLPFSDPLADGPVIQAAAQRALDNGMTVARCLDEVRALRAAIPTVPFCLMGYINPLLAYGLERFVADAAAAGADGLVVPDLPPDEPEAALLLQACAAHNLAVIALLAPTSTDERITLGVARSRGFIYLVSVTGITGARRELSATLSDFVARVRREVQRQSPAEPLSLAVGFGISTAQQAAQVAQMADGVIVGSALVKLAEQSQPDPVPAVAALAAHLRAAAALSGAGSAP
ncbi:MAG: tryptophan synthase subunit alpha [Caldilineales bacterium]